MPISGNKRQPKQEDALTILLKVLEELLELLKQLLMEQTAKMSPKGQAQPVQSAQQQSPAPEQKQSAEKIQMSPKEKRERDVRAYYHWPSVNVPSPKATNTVGPKIPPGETIKAKRPPPPNKPLPLTPPEKQKQFSKPLPPLPSQKEAASMTTNDKIAKLSESTAKGTAEATKNAQQVAREKAINSPPPNKPLPTPPAKTAAPPGETPKVETTPKGPKM